MNIFEEIINPPQVKIGGGHKKKNLSLEEQLYETVMAKMNVRKSTTEGVTSSGDISKKGPVISKKSLSISDKIEEVDSDVFITDNLIKLLTTMLTPYNKKGRGKKVVNNEIEASFGTLDGDNFFPGIKSSTEFINLLNFLTNSSYPKFYRTETEDVIEIMENPNGKGNIRCRYDISNPKDKIYENKVRNNKDALIIRRLGVRVTSSFEKEVDGNLVDEMKKNWKPHIRRVRRRTTFSTRDANSPFYGFDIDATIVEESKLSYVDEVEIVQKSFGKYELEIEAKKEGLKGEDFADLILFVYNGLIIGAYVTKNTNFSTNLIDKLTFNIVARKRIVDLHNLLFEKDVINSKWKNKDSLRMFGNYWNKPKDIKLKNLQPMIVRKGNKEYTTFHFGTSFPTVKLNGKRYMLFILKEETYLVMPPFTIIKFGKTENPEYDGTLIDGELKMSSEGIVVFHMFDILFLKGDDVKDYTFLERYDMIQSIFAKKVVEPFYALMEIKHFEIEGTIYERMRRVATTYKKMLEEDPNSTDGIIIQPSHKYFNDTTFKWKPVDKLTIDFKFIQATEKDISADITQKNYKRVFFLTVNKGKSIFKPRAEKDHDGKEIKFDGYIILDKNSIYTQWINAIVECKWDYKRKTFIPLIVRDDRGGNPNDMGPALDVWKDIVRPIALSTVTGEDLVVMRKLHNKVKNDMLKVYLKRENNIIDIGSGRGGDLNKWQELGLGKIYAIEPNENNAEELTRRLEEMNRKAFDVELLQIGAEDTKEIKKEIGDTKINAIVSFFSLTYFGESNEKYQGLLDTINLIQSGGYFIGAVMDGERVKILLERERIKMMRSREIVLEEVKTLEKELDTVMKGVSRSELNPKSYNNINELTERIRLLLQEADEKIPHSEIEKKIKALEKDQKLDRTKLTPLGDKGVKTNKSAKAGKKILTEYKPSSKAVSKDDKKILKSIEDREEIIRKYKELLLKEEFIPTDEDAGGVYYNEAFNIIQVSDFDEDPVIGNEIEVNINDPTSMVKDQQEWLFNFQFFQDKMESIGFTLIENRFIEAVDRNAVKDLPYASRILEENAIFLSPESLAWSRLNRVFSFYKD